MVASDNQSDLEIDIVDRDNDSKERQLYVDIMNVNISDGDSASPIDSVNEALAEEKSN